MLCILLYCFNIHYNINVHLICIPSFKPINIFDSLFNKARSNQFAWTSFCFDSYYNSKIVENNRAHGLNGLKIPIFDLV